MRTQADRGGQGQRRVQLSLSQVGHPAPNPRGCLRRVGALVRGGQGAGVLLQPLGREVVLRSGLPGLRAVDLIEKGAQLAQAVELQQVDGARAVERLARFQPVRALAVLVSMGAQPQVRGAAAARAGADQSSWNPPCVATWSVPGGADISDGNPARLDHRASCGLPRGTPGHSSQCRTAKRRFRTASKPINWSLRA